jgi:hypothetical protein
MNAAGIEQGQIGRLWTMSMEDAERHVGNGRAVYKSLKRDGLMATRLGGVNGRMPKMA